MNEITQITPQAKDKTRCNVYIDGRFCCGLTMETVVKNRLKAGKIVSPSQLAEMQLESEKQTALNKALTHLSATRKTERQIRDFLQKKGYLPAVCDYAVEKLREYDFLNDGEYAEAYVEQASRKKGGRLIRMELKARGLSDEAVEGALSTVDEGQALASAKEILQKYLRGKTTDKVTLQKAYRYLMGKGFDYEVARDALASIGEPNED